MHAKQIMFLGFIFAVGTLISLSFGSDWLGSADQEVANTLTVFKQANILGIWSITVPNVSFFLTGFKALLLFDFAFFSGSAGGLMQWILYFTIGLGTMWGLYTVVIGVVQGIFTRR